MIRNLLALSGLAVGLGGCISYPLGGDDILRTNAQLAQAGRILPSGADLEETGRQAGYTVIREDLPVRFGTIALTRFEQGAQRPLVIVCGGSLFRQETRGARTFTALS